MYDGERMAVLFSVRGNARIVCGRVTSEEDRDLGPVLRVRLKQNGHRATDPNDGVLSMLFRTNEPTARTGIGSSVRASMVGIRGESAPLGLSAPSEIPGRREVSSERIEAGQQLPRDVRRLIEDALSSGKSLPEIEDYLDWLENTCPSFLHLAACLCASGEAPVATRSAPTCLAVSVVAGPLPAGTVAIGADAAPGSQNVPPSRRG